MSACLPTLTRLFHRPKPATPAEPPALKTYTYATSSGVPLHVSVHLPRVSPVWPSPALLFFHGGGLLYGDRDFILHGLRKRGWTFLSYDYRKLIPCTGHDLLLDLHAAFTHYHTVLSPTLRLSATNVFVAGYSAGGYLAQLAGAHWEPKPLGMLLVAAQGGRMLSPHYYSTKGEEEGREGDEMIKKYLEGDGGRVVGGLGQLTGGEEFSARVRLCQEVWSRGVKLDLLTGIRGLSADLRGGKGEVPEAARVLFPELLIDETFPPSFVVHGDQDKLVLMEESEALVARLREKKVLVEFVVVEGAAHQVMCHEMIYRDYMAGGIKFLERRMVADEGDDEEEEEEPH